MIKSILRTFHLLVLVCLFTCVISCSQKESKEIKKTNILFALADDQTWLHSSSYGSELINTPTFDRLAKEGILFNNAFVSSPSCNPSRSSVLSGKPFYTLEGASMNFSVFPKDLTTYVDLLSENGYHVGFTGKGTLPTDWESSGRKYNPSGVEYNDILYNEGESKGIDIQKLQVNYAANFEIFLSKRKEGQPFCFWYGQNEPHRPYQVGIGQREGKNINNVQLPDFYPESDSIKYDFLDYAVNIEWGDMHLGLMLQMLEDIGELDNTLIVYTADNGMPFPRCKANLYEWGIHMPLAIRWGNMIKGGRVVDDFISFTDFAPTFLEAADISVPEDMTGKSLMPIFESDKSGVLDESRDHIVVGLERHFPGCRDGGLGYPARAFRNDQYLYIHNYAPHRWPACPPESPTWPESDKTGGFGGADGSMTKTFLINNQAKYQKEFTLAFGKRPEYELYDIVNDPYNMNNLAYDAEYEDVLKNLQELLADELLNTNDPRSTGDGALLDSLAVNYTNY